MNLFKNLFTKNKYYFFPKELTASFNYFAKVTTLNKELL